MISYGISSLNSISLLLNQSRKPFFSKSKTMNASFMSPSPPLLNGDNIESDSDTNPDQELDHYQPISATDVGDSDGCNSDDEHPRISNYDTLDNGHCSNDMSSLHINDEESDEKSSEEEEEEEERMREEIVRAFREDERRRQAPLTEENARRVMEAMRGISLPPPPIDDDQWLPRLTRLRQLHNASGTSAPNYQFGFSS